MMNYVENCVPGANSSRFIRTALTSVMLLGVLSVPVLAQDMQRYSLEKTDSGVFRLDHQTGAVDLCTEQAGKAVCTPTAAVKPDDNRTNAQIDARIDAMQQRITDLEKRLSKLDATGSSALPSEEDFEKGLSYMERFMRSFFGVAKSLDQTDPANPGRT